MKVKDSVLNELLSNKDNFLSGETLAEKLGVSRNSVWKAIKSLQTEGYNIEAVTNKGYRINDLPEDLNAGAILSMLKNTPEDFTVTVVDSINSTNTYLKEHAAEFATHDHLMIANEQTAGKGRMGRKFVSPATGIYMSYILHPKITAAEALYLTTGIAVATSLAIEEVCGIYTDIKWVNDIYINYKKICGILTEAALDFESGGLEYAVVGIGINLEMPKDSFPEEIKDIATALYEYGQVPEGIKNKLVASITDYFYDFYMHIKEKTFLTEYKKRSCIIGKNIKVIDNIFEPDKAVNAYAVDIDDGCHLIVKLEDGTTRVLSSGDVSIRPVI